MHLPRSWIKRNGHLFSDKDMQRLRQLINEESGMSAWHITDDPHDREAILFLPHNHWGIKFVLRRSRNSRVLLIREGPREIPKPLARTINSFFRRALDLKPERRKDR